MTDTLDRYLTRDIPQALMDFLESEKAEREGFMRPSDNELMQAEDRGYLAGLDAARFHLAGLMKREKAA